MRPRSDPSGLRSQYVLRATFYFGRASELVGAWRPSRLSRKARGSLDWSARAEFGVSDQAWRTAVEAGVDPVTVFCHPDVAAKHPASVDYYLRRGGLSKKGLDQLCRLVRSEAFPAKGPQVTAQALNEHTSVLLSRASRLSFASPRSSRQ